MQTLVSRFRIRKSAFHWTCFLAACFLLLCPDSRMQAQDIASMTGVVTDASGALIADAQVELKNPTTGVVYKTTSNKQGVYSIVNAQPGPGYTETVSAQGFETMVVSGIYLNVSATRTQDVTMQVGNVVQTVAVSATSESVTLDTTDSTVGNNFEAQMLNDLPVANRDNPAALFTMQPGVTLDGAVTGARVDQTNVTLDGLDVNDEATGQFGAIVGHAPVDSVQEFRGVTAGDTANAGQGGGGQFDLVTRSGTNTFHGSLVEYHRDTDLEANDWFNNDDGVSRPPLIRNQFGGNIGGPIKHDKAFFFFDWNSRRDTLSNLEERVVPMASFRNGDVSYCNNTSTQFPCSTSTLTSAQVAELDPQGIGFDPAILQVITGRYPAPNDLSGNHGDLVNTAGFRFNAPFPLVENDYVGRVDYSINENQKLWGRVTFARENATQQAIHFPGDPETYPFLDKSYGWVVGHTWAIGSNKSNQASWGETYEDYDFPNTYNPTGITQYSFGGIPSGGTFMTAPYGSAVNAQGRTYPIPVIRDDFTWTKGKHNLTMGGTFKYENPSGFTYLNYNSPTVGLGGHLSGLTPSLRPADIWTDSKSIGYWDSEFTFALGRYQSVSSTFNYDSKGSIVPQGSGSHDHYRLYETELYFGDNWKMTPDLTVSYGIRWQNYSVPYEVNGIESLPNLDFHQFFDARIAQSAAGIYGPSTDCAPSSGGGVPCVSYVLGGKANNGPGYFNPQYDNFAPRLAIAYSPSFDRKSVFSLGGGVVFDHTVVNAVQYQASQYSYLFQASAQAQYGTAGNPTASLMNDPRFSGFNSPPPPPAAPAAIKPPFTPFVASGQPYGLANGGAFNEGVDHNLRTPYSIQYIAGYQHEFPQGFLLKANYVGRLGRRLLGQVDANQLIEFPDSVGHSGQSMSQAFGALTKQVRSNPSYYLNQNPNNVTPQPWFENMLSANANGLTPADFGVPTWTSVISNYIGDLAYRGDFADTMQALAGAGALPDNVGMGSQFSEFTYYTNGGRSNYNGLLLTLHKNSGFGLQFDINYTYAHSLDNVSVIANAPAIGGYGFICDALRTGLCYGNSDFDVKHYLNGEFVYELPIGQGKAVGSNAPHWANEIIGGWELSGLPSWHSGTAYFAASNAFVAGYANDAPAILVGNKSDVAIHMHKDSTGTLWAYKSDDQPAATDYTGPVGFQIGGRNNLRGPGYADVDLGLGKTFPLFEGVNLKFRADAFNSLNHPSFNTPSNDITESSGLFGVISSTSSSARVLQLALRLEF